MSLGVRNVDDGDIDKMMAEAPGALNFTTFLNMLAEKLHGTDSEDVILEGKNFGFFDKNRWKWPKSEKVGYEVRITNPNKIRVCSMSLEIHGP